MIINHNLAAMNANRNMNINSASANKSMQKLSSGLRINSAADDAAGLAISEKMRGQIRGLDQASSNSQDGISLIQTAEGALNETTSILQRVRELAVQSANGSLTDEDRAAAQSEASQLIDEVDNIGNQTQFNTKSLLNGNVASAIHADGAAVSGVGTSADTESNLYTITFGQDAKNAVLTNADKGDFITALGVTQNIQSGHGSVININGQSVSIANGDSIKDVIGKINLLSSKTGVNAMVGAKGGLQLESIGVGSSQVLQVTGSNTTLIALGLTTGPEGALSAAGTDAQVQITSPSATNKDMVASGNQLTAGADAKEASGLTLQLSGTETSATMSLRYIDNTTSAQSFSLNGLKITLGTTDTLAQAVANINGANNANTFLTGVTASAGKDSTGAAAIILTSTATGKNATINVSGLTGTASVGLAGGTSTNFLSIDGGAANTLASGADSGTSGINATNTNGQVRVSNDDTLKFHTGANSGQTLELSIDDMRATAIGKNVANSSNLNSLEDIKDQNALSTAPKAEDALKVIDEAIKNVSSERAKLGAYQNRLEHTIANLGTSSENLSSAESRIRDVDMAKEMSTFSKNNILSQAAQAMLAQANQQPSQVLQLLR